MKNILRLNRVTINKLGISNSTKNSEIHIPIFDNGLVVGTRATLFEIDSAKCNTELIDVTTIDNYVEKNKIKNVSFIKCDTEGNELNVLEGGIKTISFFLPILSFEISY